MKAELFLAMVCIAGGAYAAPLSGKVYSLWPDVKEDAPTLTVHLPENSGGRRCPAFVIFPGGGYRMLCDTYEGHDLAKWFNGRGIAGIVLKYRLAPKYDHHAIYADAEESLRYVRSHAEEWGVDPARIGVIGFSAGGHLAASVSTLMKDGGPDFTALVYPYISMGKELGHEHMRADFLGKGYADELVRRFSADLQITDRTPPMFIAHAKTDKVVNIAHSRNLVAAMRAKGRQVSYFELTKGEHGLGAGKGEDWAAWLQVFDKWLKERGLVMSDSSSGRLLEPLGPGEVKPCGWLLDRARAMAAGYTGHAHEYHQDFALPWTAQFKEPRPAPHCWPYECGAYWLDGLARLAYQLDDPQLISLVKARVNPVLEGISEDSIMFYTCMSRTNAVDRETIEKERFFVRASGQYARGLWAYYLATHDERVIRAFRCAYNGDPDWLQGCCSVKGVSSIMDAYRLCGGERMAKMFDFLYDRNQPRRSDWVWHDYLEYPKPGDYSFLNGIQKGVKDGWAHYHGVMMSETLGSLAMGTAWTGSRYYVDKSIAWYDLIHANCEQVHGVVVCDEQFARPGAYRGTETCVVAGQLWDDFIFLSLTGDGRFADYAERAALNAGPICTSRDARSHVYFQAPNRVELPTCGLFREGPKNSGGVYKREHHPRCCMAALNRILPLQIQHMWMKRDDGLVAALYGPNVLETSLPTAGKVRIESETQYPFEETVRMKMTVETASRFPLWVRMPQWCAAPAVSINGGKVAFSVEKGFARFDREWKTGDELCLSLPQKVKVETGKDFNAGGAPYAAVTLGPLVMSLPLEGENENVQRNGAHWLFAYDPVSFSAKISRENVRPGFDWPVDAPVKVSVSLVAADWCHDRNWPRLPTQGAIASRNQHPLASLGEDETVTLVPYGCARMRVTLFPAVDRTKPDNRFNVVDIPSSADGTVQKAYFRPAPGNGAPKPLLVSLHPWSGGYTMPEYMDGDILDSDINFIRPDFRGANCKPDACISAKVLSDIEDAIAYAIANGNVDTNRITVCGVSGGGLATLAAYRHTRHPVRRFLAWVPISDLAAWYGESIALGTKYVKELEGVCGGKFNAEDLRRRSPAYMKQKVRDGAELEIYAGIHDGHAPAVVPISQSIDFYNRLADERGHAGAKVTAKERDSLLKRDLSAFGDTAQWLGRRKVLFKREFPGVKLFIFEGTHEILADVAFKRATSW